MRAVRGKHNLPAQITTFIGRDKERAELVRLIDSSPLLTLTGTGGAGKTRLALEVASAVLDEFPGGVWLVELASIFDPELVAQRLGALLGVRDAGLQAIRSRLQAAPTLVVLDNCEHLLDACGDLAAVLVESCPELRLMTTSREPLSVKGERVWVVPPLSLPPHRRPGATQALASYESVRLFADRACMVRRDFALDAANAADVAEICRRLDGLPLAIELAAARVNVLSCSELALRLEDRFRLLRSPQRGRPGRHQTLEAMIDWSYELLSDDERSALHGVSVFTGGFTIEAAAEVTMLDEARLVDVLGSLIDKSLVGASDGSRHHLLETIRSYAWRQAEGAGALPALRSRHAHYFLALAVTSARHLTGAEQQEWLERLESEHDNLLRALDWLDSDPGGAEHELQLASALVTFWEVRGHWHEGRGRLTRALGRPTANPQARIAALRGLGHVSFRLGEYDRAREAFRSVLKLARAIDDTRSVAHALSDLGNVGYRVGDVAEALSHYQEARALFESLDDRKALASVLINLGVAAVRQERFEEARSYYEKGLAQTRAVKDPRNIAVALLNLSAIEAHLGDIESARVRVEEGVTIARGLGDKPLVPKLLVQLGSISRREGDIPSALAAVEEGIELAREQSDMEALSYLTSELARISHDSGDLPAARAYFEEALALAESIGSDVCATHAREGLEELATQPEPDEAPHTLPSIFSREADYWTIEHLGRTVRLKDSRGLAFIAHLLCHPKREFHVLDLVSQVEGLMTAPQIDTAARIGPRAREVSLRRVEELRAELEEAEEWRDPERAAAARRGLDELLQRLAGSGGKHRGAPTEADRARWAVAKAVSRAVKQIADGHPELGRHLAQSVRTGLYCAYEPGEPVRWSASAVK